MICNYPSSYDSENKKAIITFFLDYRFLKNIINSGNYYDSDHSNYEDMILYVILPLFQRGMLQLKFRTKCQDIKQQSSQVPPEITRTILIFIEGGFIWLYYWYNVRHTGVLGLQKEKRVIKGYHVFEYWQMKFVDSRQLNNIKRRIITVRLTIKLLNGTLQDTNTFSNCVGSMQRNRKLDLVKIFTQVSSTIFKE